MTAIERTPCPRFKRSLTAKDLAKVYTPTSGGGFLALRSTKVSVAELGFLVLLKTYQRQGSFIPLGQVPAPIIEHIAKLMIHILMSLIWTITRKEELCSLDETALAINMNRKRYLLF